MIVHISQLIRIHTVLDQRCFSSTQVIYINLKYVKEIITFDSWGGSRGGTGGLDPPLPPGKVAIGFLRNAGTDPLEKQLDPFSREACMALCEIF